MKLSSPAPGRPITSAYGWRTHPLTGQRRLHRGIDFGGRFPVVAAADGRVIKNGASLSRLSGYGYYLIIEHTPKLRTLYAHGAHRSRRQERERITRLDLVFTSGSTGATTGDHLHFEVHVRNRFGIWVAVDPTPYLATAPPSPPQSSKIERKKRTWHG